MLLVVFNENSNKLSKLYTLEIFQSIYYVNTNALSFPRKLKNIFDIPYSVSIRPSVCLSVNVLHFHLLLQNQLDFAQSISEYGDSKGQVPKPFTRELHVHKSPNLVLPCFKFNRAQKHLHFLL